MRTKETPSTDIGPYQQEWEGEGNVTGDNYMRDS